MVSQNVFLVDSLLHLFATFPSHGVQTIVAGVVPHLSQEEIVKRHLGLRIHVLQVPPCSLYLHHHNYHFHLYYHSNFHI